MKQLLYVIVVFKSLSLSTLEFHSERGFICQLSYLDIDFTLNMPVSKSIFDQANNITLFTLTSNQLTVKIIDYGATLVSVIFADRDNVPRDLVLGFDNLDGYQSKVLRNPYFGASIGRVGNR